MSFPKKPPTLRNIQYLEFTSVPYKTCRAECGKVCNYFRHESTYLAGRIKRNLSNNFVTTQKVKNGYLQISYFF